MTQPSRLICPTHGTFHSVSEPCQHCERVKQLLDLVNHHQQKWTRLEQEYILPCFEIAKQNGLNLQQMVIDHAGKNCVIILLETLLTRLHTAEQRAADAERHDPRC